MFTSKDIRSLSFIGRQLSRLLETHDPDEAFSRLRQATGPSFTAEIERLEALFAVPDSISVRSGSGPYAKLASLMPAAGRARSRFFREFTEYVRQSSVVYRNWWNGLLGLTGYLSVLCVFAAAVSATFALSVLPSFRQMFATVGGELPSFTATVFSLHTSGFPIVAFIVVGIVGVAVWFSVLFRRRVQEFAPLPRWRGLPMLGSLAQTYNYGLFLNFARLLLRCDVPPACAVDIAAAHSNQVPGLTFARLTSHDSPESGDRRCIAELTIAMKLGNLAPELEAQCDEHWTRLANDLVRVRERLGLALKVVVYALLAALVIAMYLPIFQMGNVV